MRSWRNWQTRKTKDLVVHTMQVQFLSTAPKPLSLFQAQGFSFSFSSCKTPPSALSLRFFLSAHESKIFVVRNAPPDLIGKFSEQEIFLCIIFLQNALQITDKWSDEGLDAFPQIGKADAAERYRRRIVRSFVPQMIITDKDLRMRLMKRFRAVFHEITLTVESMKPTINKDQIGDIPTPAAMVFHDLFRR